MHLLLRIPAPLAQPPSDASLHTDLVHRPALPCLFHIAGALRLASLVQYVPLPVIGGYLAFVGYFCLTAGGWLGGSQAVCCNACGGQSCSYKAIYGCFQQCPPPHQRKQPACPPPAAAAGMGLASGVQISGLASWLQLASWEVLLKLAPALAMLILITVVLHSIRSVGEGWQRLPGAEERA